MKTLRIRTHVRLSGLLAMTLAIVMSGCESPSATHMNTPSAAEPAKHVAADAPKAAAVQRPTIRIKAGAETEFTDSAGVKWGPDHGFDDGSVEDRPDLPITGTKTPELYRTERYSMGSYSFDLPNGPYLLKLHFSEDYDGNTEPESRLFTYAVKDGKVNGKTVKEVKDFSPWKAAGAQFKAYVDSVPVNVTQGAISIVFTPQAENPQINAIEIIPQ